jgi:hypothetical protein
LAIPTGPKEIFILIWERGAGETQASGPPLVQPPVRRFAGAESPSQSRCGRRLALTSRRTSV